jgi:uncharacterized protein
MTITKKIVSRRSFLYGAAGTVLAASAEGMAISQNETTEQLGVEEKTVFIRNLPSEFQEYRIGFITDIHLGMSVRNNFVEHAFDEVMHRKPDLLVLGGDYVWVPKYGLTKMMAPKRNAEFVHGSGTALASAIMEKIQKIILRHTLPDGIVGVMGNHDRVFPLSICKNPLVKAGVQVLVNSTFEIKRGKSVLQVIGVDDLWNGDAKLPVNIQKEKLKLLVTHNPDFVTHVLTTTEHEFDLVLCGHTHGGQIKLPPFGFAPLWRTNTYELLSGFYSHPRLTSYTSRGIGVSGGINYRVDCPPEVNVFELKNV